MNNEKEIKRQLGHQLIPVKPTFTPPRAINAIVVTKQVVTTKGAGK